MITLLRKCYCDGEGKYECVCVCVCAYVFFDVKVYNMCYVQTCKVQHSPVSNKTELQSRYGIPLHSMDSASPGGWINVCTRSHKQSLFSPRTPMQPHTSDQSHSKQSYPTDTKPLSTRDVSDSSWHEDACFSNSLWRKLSRSQETLLSNSRNMQQDYRAWLMLGLTIVKNFPTLISERILLVHGIQRNLYKKEKW